MASTSNPPEPELIADYQCETGEGPVWHPDERRVYWVDIPNGRLFRYEPATGTHEQCYEGDPIGGFTMQEDGALLLFQSRGAIREWRDGTLRTIVDEIPHDRDSRFNDVIADPLGGVFCGTMATKDHPGKLYRLAPDGSLSVVLDEVRTPNGMGFTPDRRRMYFTDSPRHEISLFDYDHVTGTVSNRRVFVRTEPDQGVPDGMTVDAQGYVWSARWDGNCLVRYAPDGHEERRVFFPANKVSSVAFGGADYADMYVTCAGGPNKATEGPGAGALFRLRLGIKGAPEFRSRVRRPA
jgi:D-xylonolactonase